MVGDDTEELSTAVVGRPETDVVAWSDVGVRKIKPVAIGVGEGVGVSLGVVGKDPLLGGSAVGFVKLNIGAWGRVVVVKVDYDIRVDGSRDGVGTVREWLTSVEIPLLGDGAVGIPNLDVGANGTIGIINVEGATRMTGRDKRVGAVAVSKNLPVLGTGAIAVPELDIGASSSAGVVDVKVATGDEVAEGIIAGRLTFEVPLVGGGIRGGGEVDVGRVLDTIGAEADVTSDSGSELIDAVREVDGVSMGRERVGLGRDLGAAEPISEVEIEIAVAVGRADIAGAVAGGKSGGIRLIRRVAVEGGGGTVLDKDLGATATSVGAEADVNASRLFGVGGVAIVEDAAEEIGGVANLVLETVILSVAGVGIGAAVAGGGTILTAVGVGVGDKALLLLEKDNENLGVDAVILGSLIDNLSGSLARANDGAVTEAFFGETDKVAVGAALPMPSYIGIEGGLFLIEGIIAVVAGVFLGKEGLDFLYGHGVVVAHDSVAHDIAGAKSGR